MSQFAMDFFDEEDEYGFLFENEQYEEGWKKLFALEDSLKACSDEEREGLDYQWYEDILKYSAISKRFDIGDSYVDIFENNNTDRADFHYRYIAIGEYYLAKGETKKAKEYFIKCYQYDNYGKNAMKRAEYQEYLEMIAEDVGYKIRVKKKKGSSAVTNKELEENYENNIEKIEEFCAKGNASADEERYQEAFDLFMEAWKLIPDPKGSYDEASWIAASLGDMSYEMGNLEDANYYFEEAYYAINGEFEGYINFMRGKCLYETGKKDEAISYFIMAYELANDDIFKYDPEYLQLVKNANKK